MRGPFRVISSVQSIYQVQSCTDPDKIISIHSARLRKLYSNLEYPLSPTEVAVTDNQEFVIDYIADHDGETSDLESLIFEARWLWYENTDDIWNSFKSLRNTSAINTYIFDHITDHPDLIRLIARCNRKLLSMTTIKGIQYYTFSFLEGTIGLPEDQIRPLPDRTTLWREAKALNSSPPVLTTKRRNNKKT